MRMRIVSAVLASSFLLVLAAPAADAAMWSSFSATVNKYDIRASIRARKSPPKRPASVELPAAAKGALLWGNPEATTTIVMFSDLECPFCKQFHKKTYPTLKKDYIDTGKVRFVVRHYPLSFHKNARPAAEAVVCARAGGDDKARALYERIMAMSPVDGAEVEADVVDLGLDASKLAECMNAEKTRQTIDADMKIGSDANVSGTPSFLIVGPGGATEKVMGAMPASSFAKAIEAVQKK